MNTKDRYLVITSQGKVIDQFKSLIRAQDRAEKALKNNFDSVCIALIVHTFERKYEIVEKEYHLPVKE